MHRNPARAFALAANLFTHALLLGIGSVAVFACTGCQLWRPDRGGGKDYQDMRNSVEGYHDDEGNWVRPEGAKAEKKRGSTTHAIAQYIPGLADRPAEPEKAKELYAEAEKTFEEAKNSKDSERLKLFHKAAGQYKNAAKHWQSSYLENDALMMAGESYFFAEEYKNAEEQYARVLKEHPRSKYQDLIDSRRMEIGMYWLQLRKDQPSSSYMVNLTDKKRPWSDTGGHGRRTLENVRMTNPTGRLSDDVTMVLGNEAFQRGAYQDAADHYSDLRITHPESPHQFEAHFLGLKSIMETYEGADYTENPLNEADKLVKQINKQFPKESQENREFLTRAYAEIRYRKAERLWTRAEWRINRGENNAAKMYLDRILTEFNDTPFADKAREAQSKIDGRPGEPVQQFSWLANLFNDRDPVKEYLHSSDPKESSSWIPNPFSSSKSSNP